MSQYSSLLNTPSSLIWLNNHFATVCPVRIRSFRHFLAPSRVIFFRSGRRGNMDSIQSPQHPSKSMWFLLTIIPHCNRILRQNWQYWAIFQSLATSSTHRCCYFLRIWIRSSTFITLMQLVLELLFLFFFVLFFPLNHNRSEVNSIYDIQYHLYRVHLAW